MKVAILCEYSGTVRDAFIKQGHDAISCDILPTDSPGPHIQGDIKDQDWSGYDLIIAHPPCTYLSVSGLHWNKRIEGRSEKTEEALKFVKWIMDLPCSRIVVENPVSCISSRIRKPEQIIQPWQFGHDASKKTCLWIKGLPLLKYTKIIKKDRYANQTASGQNNLPPSKDRWKIRSLTYQGIADAMAEQWGNEN